MLNETFNDVPVEQETEDDDTITYMSGNNGKPLPMLIKKEFDLNKTTLKFYQQDKIVKKIIILKYIIEKDTDAPVNL